MTLYDYGQYEELFADKRSGEALQKLRIVSRETGIRHYLVGGGAAYLWSENPPEDEPDFDFFLDATAEEADRFVRKLTKRGFALVSRPSIEGDDAFFMLDYKGVQFDLFTNQEQREEIRKGMEIRKIHVEPIECLIIEKLIRATYEDLLMAADLLMTDRYNPEILWEAARERILAIQLSKVKRIADHLVSGKLTRATAKLMLRRMARKEGLEA